MKGGHELKKIEVQLAITYWFASLSSPIQLSDLGAKNLSN